MLNQRKMLQNFFSHFFIKSVNWCFLKISNEDYLIGSYGKFLKKKKLKLKEKIEIFTFLQKLIQFLY